MVIAQRSFSILSSYTPQTVSILLYLNYVQKHLQPKGYTSATRAQIGKFMVEVFDKTKKKAPTTSPKQYYSIVFNTSLFQNCNNVYGSLKIYHTDAT